MRICLAMAALAQLRKIIAAGNVSALFSEPQYSPKSMQVIGKEFKVPVIQLDPMETGDGSKDFYERVTQKNLDALGIETFIPIRKLK